MKHAYQDDEALYIIMDVALGGDLEFQRTHRFKDKIFPEKVAKFCAVETFLALRYLHSINLLHRDIKVIFAVGD
jgi:serine/threonine kinase 32